MSSTFPPGDPQGPEYLEQGAGAPVSPERSSGGGRKALLAVGAVAGLALVGGGVWAAVSFFGTGPQPAEALPASTLGYASIDLDPSGGQKIEALKMLNKFPAFEDEVGLDTDDDLREKLFEELDLEENCDGLDYADDIEPWLGDRVAVAAVDLGEDQPAPVVALQVKDAGRAEDGLGALFDCATEANGGEQEAGFVVSGDWAVIAETDDIAQDMVDEAADESLADDEDFQKWTDEAGDAGIMTMYAAPEAGQYLADSLGDVFGMGSAMAGSTTACSFDTETGEEFCETDPMAAEMPEPEMPEEMREQLEDFQGAAMTLRFDDGAVELEMAGDSSLADNGMPTTDTGDDVLATLPEDTAVAFGIGFAEGWFDQVLEQMGSISGGMSVDELIEQAEAETGLELPEDAETLAGESVAIALDGDFDPESMVNSSDGTDIPFGVKVQGDPAAIEDVLAKLQPEVTAEGGPELVTESNDDQIAIGFDEDYVGTLAEDGGLGDSDVFENVVREADDSSVVLFVNFDAGDGWLDALVDADAAVAENVAPLEGLGMSAWVDDDVAHAVIRLTTD